MRAGLAHSIRFDPADPGASLSGLPEAPAVFALCAADPAAEPYLSKTPNLRRRLMRFLRGPQRRRDASRKRLQLAHMVDHIEYSVTGSEFESSLCLYQASLRAFGNGRKSGCVFALRRFLRMSVDNAVSAGLRDVQDQQDGGERSLWPVSFARGGRALCG